MSETIVSTKEQVGTYDAIETLKPGEPVFPLQGGDPLAPFCVIIWAWKARKLARTLDPDKDAKEIERLLRKASAAEEVAWAMRDYQRGGDLPPAIEEAPVQSYGGIVPAAKGAWLPGIVAGVRHLNEAVAAFSDAAEHLPPDQGRALLGIVEAVKAASAKYQPRRASYPNEPEFPTA
jgi:hypothetical protein